MRKVQLPGGEHVAALGLGTWMMGERGAAAVEEEVAALRLGLDLGLSLIDTAELYGDGRAETIVGKAIAGRRDHIFLVSKVLPQNASRQGVAAACERSLARLGTDRLDLYLLHWRGDVPLAETLAGFLDLQRAGKIRHWGVSNLDQVEMTELSALPGGERCATDQLLYNLTRRGIEADLLPWCRARRLPIMAYSPIEQGRLLTDRTLMRLAAARGVTPAQLALAWVLRQPDVIAIPKASRLDHLRENAAALALKLTPEELAALDQAHPPPIRPRSLEML